MKYSLRLLKVLPLVLGCIIFSSRADAQIQQPASIDDKAIFSVVFENDIFGGTDQNYTNGVRFAWQNAVDTTPEWAVWIADNLLPLAVEGRKRISIAAGQNMYTPLDLTRRDLVNDDRPYAGWLYGSVGMVSDTGTRLDNVMLTVGMVGPSSLAEDTQKFIHRQIDSQHPYGWDNQLDDELGVVLTMERKWRALYEFSPFGAGVDITPHAGFNVGNINTDASTGLVFRLGYDLPADYGPPRVRPSLPGSDFFVPTQNLSGYLFAGVDGRAVGRNIFLDGNTFRDSHSVDKRNFVGSAQIGAALTYHDTRVSYTHVLMTREFEQQKSAQQFGVITVSMRF